MPWVCMSSTYSHTVILVQYDEDMSLMDWQPVKVPIHRPLTAGDTRPHPLSVQKFNFNWC